MMMNKVSELMRDREFIRNVSIIAHVDHGKTALTESLTHVHMDVGEEKDRGITIKSAAVSLQFSRKEKRIEKEAKEEIEIDQPYLINLIDSPGHVDFSSEVTAALRITDGAICVIDCIEGVCVQTETVLRQAIAERIRPILFLNKLDRLFLEASLTLDECYKNLRNSIETVNVICQTYKDEKLGKLELWPQEGNIAFGSALHGWGFTLKQFAKMYANKFSLPVNKLMKKLWGENYWDSNRKKWVKRNPLKTLLRGFEQFIIKPIHVLIDIIMTEQKHIYEPLIHSLRFTSNEECVIIIDGYIRRQQKYLSQIIPSEINYICSAYYFQKSCENMQYKTKKPKTLLTSVLSTWLPIQNVLLDMIIEHLPSPIIAQSYRVDNLYEGALDSKEANDIRQCNPNGIMSMYVSKMIPMTETERFIVFGRVFSGKLKVGQEIRIMGPDYVIGKKRDLFIKKVEKILFMNDKHIEQIKECCAGNVCGIIGIDQYLLKSGTLSTSDTFHPFNTITINGAAVIRVAVEPTSAGDLPQLIQGLKCLLKSDPLVKCSTSKSGQHIIAGSNELHLEYCLNDLRSQYMKNIHIRVSEAVVSYKETICSSTGCNEKYPKICVAKSPNKHNRIYMYAEPLEETFIDAIEKNEINLTYSTDIKQFSKILNTKYGWNVGEARKIWSFGCPPDCKANVVVDMTKGVQFVNEKKDHVVGAFMQVTSGGVLCDEPMRGIRFNISDIKSNADAIHRGAGQIMPCAKKAFYACQIASSPRLLEPVYLIDIIAPESVHSGIFKTLNIKRGEIEKIEDRIGTSLTQIQGYLPVIESFGFNELLKQNTKGEACANMKFSHWKIISSDPFTENSNAYNVLMDTRKRKGLKLKLPVFNDYYDRV
eukprot:420731_1